MGGRPLNFSSGGAMGRDMAKRMGERPCHFGVGMSTRSGTNEMPDKDDNHFNYSYNLTVEDSGFQTGGMVTTMGRVNFESQNNKKAAISNQERAGAY